MIIKKYKAKSEKEAMLMAQGELGSGAIVMNVKTIKPRGIIGLFRKQRVELTAAIDDYDEAKAENVDEAHDERDGYRFGTAFSGDKKRYNENTQNAIEEKINNIARLLEQQMNHPSDEEVSGVKPAVNYEDKRDIISHDNETDEANGKSDSSENRVVGLIKSQLIKSEVSEKYAELIIEELESAGEKQTVDNALSNAYQKIVLKLGEVSALKSSEKKPRIIFFVGNTGVGKTTTMAKLASKCKLCDKLSVAMFSVDTYRIAAIEQIKTYANILNAPMEVVYTPDDMKKYVDKYSDCDLIMVDTAGRSHRNKEQQEDLKAILESVSDYDREIYLVVSVATKYADLFDIADTYSKMFDYNIIFTKLDETSGLGSILNLKLDTGKNLSYVTWGQNVPDDIGVINPQIIAKRLLGGAN